MFNLNLNATTSVVKRRLKQEAHLVDGSNMYCRAQCKSLQTTVSRFIKMFGTVPKSAQYMAVVFDDASHTWRHELYSNYKSSRTRSHQNQNGLRVIRKLLQYRGIRVLASDEYEADDLIASAARILRKYPVYIHSEDKDFYQLLNDNVSLIKAHKLYTAENLQKSSGMTPAMYLESQILVGDSVDDIPGFPMWGKGSASTYLQKYGSLDAIIEHSHELPTKLRNGLVKGLPSRKLVQKLVTLKQTALKEDASFFLVNSPDIEKMASLANRYDLSLTGFL